MLYDFDSDGDDCWLEVQTPTITSPVNGATGVSFALGVTIQTSAFVPNILGITLGSTEYELRTSIGGPVVGTGSSLLNTSVIIPGLQLSANTTFFVRVRHVSATYGGGLTGSSWWSNYISFTTGAL